MRVGRFCFGAFAGLALCCAVSGCKRLDDAIPPPDEFESCQGDATTAEVQENLVIATEYSLAVSTDLQLSWTFFLFTFDFIALWSATLSHNPAEPSPGWIFDNGTYRYGSEAAAIELRATLTEDSILGPAGTPVTSDILALDSFLVGATFTTEQATGTVTISFDAPGPLAPLLGLGDSPTSPVVLDPQARQDVLDALGKIGVQVEYIAYGIAQSTLVDYHAASPVRTLTELSEGASFPVDLVAVNASREALDQTLTTEAWEVTRMGSHVSGFTTFRVDGGHFPYVGRLDFGDAQGLVYASIDIDCP